MRKRVYIPNKGPYDYSDAAKRFGELVFCTAGNIDKFDLGQMYRGLEEAMQDSQPGDYILLGSLTSLCCIACAIFVAKHKQLHLLIYRDNHYIERSIVFNDLMEPPPLIEQEVEEVDGNR